MNLTINLILNFFVGFISDIILNDLSKIRNLTYINSLRPYFDNKSITMAGIYAGLTTSFCIFLSVIISKYIKINYYVIVFLVGYLVDIYIEKFRIFSNLEEYYNTVGSGIWGGFAILFSSLISYVIYYYFLPIIYACKK